MDSKKVSIEQDCFSFINKRMALSLEKYSLGLANGKMGFCIYFYHLSRIYGNTEYEEIAEKILDTVIGSIPPYESIDTLSISAGNGLASIAIGIDHLLKQKFIKGDINEILKDIDDTIFKKIAFEENKFADIFVEEQIYLLYYLYIRYVEQKEEDGIFLFGELIINVIESIDKKINPSFFYEPLSFSIGYSLPVFLILLSKIMSLNIYNCRIGKILDRYMIQIYSIFPTSHANRLLLLTGIMHVKDYYETDELEKLVSLLKKNIDVNHILDEELTDMQLFIFNGVSLVYFLLSYINEKHMKSFIDFDVKKIYSRIINSELWKAQESDDYSYGIIGGISGVILTLSYMRKHYKL